MSRLQRRIWAFVARKAGNAQPNRAPSASEVSRKAINVACSDMEDIQAVARLRGIAAENVGATRRALESLSRARTEYATDRAYRLLLAAVDGVSVSAPPGELRELFDREGELGRLPIERAVAKLVELEPRLEEVMSKRTSVTGRSRLMQAKAVMGPGSDNPDLLVQSNLALSIVSQYLEAGDDGADLSDGEGSYFGAHRKRVVRRVF